MHILPYHLEPAGYHEWDPRTPTVASELRTFIEGKVPGVIVEHVGSTSIPGCAGKGIIDLMLVYPRGTLAVTRDSVGRLGFQHQMGRDPFPEERPMRVGMILHDGVEYRIHLHVLSEDSPEVSEFRSFRDALRADHALMDAYMVRKRDIIAAGITEPKEYAHTKGSFCAEVVAETKRACVPR